MKRTLKLSHTPAPPPALIKCTKCGFMSYAPYAAKLHAKRTGHYVCEETLTGVKGATHNGQT